MSGATRCRFVVTDRRDVHDVVEQRALVPEVVRGLALSDPAGSLSLALRHDPARAAAMAGFDLLALLVPTRDAVQDWRRRLDELDQPHGGVVTGHHGGSVLVGLRDPDGIEIRLYAD